MGDRSLKQATESVIGSINYLLGYIRGQGAETIAQELERIAGSEGRLGEALMTLRKMAGLADPQLTPGPMVPADGPEDVKGLIRKADALRAIHGVASFLPKGEALDKLTEVENRIREIRDEAPES